MKLELAIAWAESMQHTTDIHYLADKQQILLATGSPASVRLLDLYGNELNRWTSKTNHVINRLVISSDRQWVYASNFNGNTIYVLDLATLSLQQEFVFPSSFISDFAIGTHTNFMLVNCFHPDFDTIVYASNTTNGSYDIVADGAKGSLHPSGNQFALLTIDGVYIFDTTTKEILQHLQISASEAWYSPSGQYLAFTVNAPKFEKIILYDTATWNIIHKFDINFFVGDLKFLTQEQYFVTLNSDDSLLNLWDTATGKMISAYSHIGETNIRSISIDAADTYVACCGHEQKTGKTEVEFWEISL